MHEFLSQLLTMSAAAAVAALLVMALRLPLKRAPRWITCALWLVVLVRMVCPISLSLPVSLIPAQVSSGAAVQKVLPAPQQTAPPLSEVGQTVSALPAAPAAGFSQAIPDSAAETAPAVSTLSPALSRTEVLFLLWAVGCGGFLLWGLLSSLHWKGRLAEAVRIEGNLYESDRIDTPFVWGIVHPRIYLPVGLSEADRPYVLLHEQAHIRRLDYLTKPLSYLCMCLHWFNPVLWFGYFLFCRDVETACDQRVLRSFDREDTAGYAAALLRLGRRRPLPQAVPLAFGETAFRARVKGVLNYRRPRVMVCALAVLVCLLMAILLLANPGVKGEQLEGVAITDCYIWDGNLPVDLPVELREELVSLLKEAGHDGYVKSEVSLAEIGRASVLVLADGNHGTEYWLINAAEPLSLVRNNHDGYTFQKKPQQAAGLSKLCSMPAYTQWWEKVQTYLNDQRVTELYALKTPYIGNQVECGKILDTLNAKEVIGSFTMELQTSQEPYGIVLHAEGNPEDLDADSLHAVSDLFLALVDNAGTFTVVYEDAEVPRSLVSTATDGLKNLSLDEFQSLYQQRCHESPADTYWAPTKSLYLSPTLFPEVTDEGESVYSGSAFVMDLDHFTVNLNCVYSSANPFIETIWWPAYESHPVPDSPAAGDESEAAPLTVPDGTVLLETANRAYCSVNNGDGSFTGYRFYYPIDSEVETTGYMAHFTEAGELDYLFQVRQKEGTVTPGGVLSP